MTIKKYIFCCLHALAILLIAAGSGLLILGTPSQNNFHMATSPAFEDSEEFTEIISRNIDQIFEYIDLKNVFETNGTLDMTKTIALVSSGETKTSYSLDQLLKFARAKGYYLNENYEMVSGNASSSPHTEEAVVSVTYRAYLPDFKPVSPTDTFMTIQQLSVETLDYLSEYYQLRNQFIDTPSNLKFKVHYETDTEQRDYSNASELEKDDLVESGRFLLTSSDSVEIKTNMAQVPVNLIPLLQAKDPYDSGHYYMALNINTAYPYSDEIKTAYTDYTQARISGIRGLICLSCGIAFWLISLMPMFILSGRDKQHGITLYAIDRIPLEVLAASWILIWFFIGWISTSLCRISFTILGIINPSEYWFVMLKYIMEYAVGIFFVFSLVRRYKSETLLQTSLLGRIYQTVLNSNLTDSKAFGTLFFLIPNLLGATVEILLLFLFFTEYNLLLFLAALLLLFSLIAINLYTFKISTGLSAAVTEQVKSERMKADLITNVSHDIKTPLTSIINYVDLLKRQHIENPTALQYLEILDQKSQRLKTLIEDLVEASKASSGNITLEMTDLDLVSMAQQTVGEFEDRFMERRLEIISKIPDHSIMIRADGRRLWRVLENLFGNTFKYALEGSRVYVDVYENETSAMFTIKNISERPLNISADELTERFVRGDVSRTTEGYGLGLSIAQSLTKLQGGQLDISIDGDLFKASITFPKL